MRQFLGGLVVALLVVCTAGCGTVVPRASRDNVVQTIPAVYHSVPQTPQAPQWQHSPVRGFDTKNRAPGMPLEVLMSLPPGEYVIQQCDDVFVILPKQLSVKQLHEPVYRVPRTSTFPEATQLPQRYEACNKTWPQ